MRRIRRYRDTVALGSASAGYGAITMANTMSNLPEQLARSVTCYRGKEMSAHGLLRQYFLMGTDLARWLAEELEAVAHAL